MKKDDSASILRFTRDFSLKEMRKINLFPSLFFLAFIFFPVKSFPHSPEIPRITQVSIMIDGQPAEESIQGLIPIKEGDSFSLKKITESIRQVYKTGIFSDVQVLRSGGEEVQLTYLLTRKLFTRRIVFRGQKRASARKLKERLTSLHEGGFFSEERLSKATEEVKDALTNEGYFYPEVKASAERAGQSPVVGVLFDIQSAKRFLIRKISFSGQEVLAEAELKKKMRSKEEKFFIPSIVEQDIQKLKRILNLMDYQRAEVELERKEFDEKEGVVDLRLRVNPQQKIEIVVEGAQIPLDLLRPIWEAEIFEEWGLAEGEAKIIGHLRRRGYLFASVNSFIENVGNTMRVVYKVTPNEMVQVEGISFEGVKHFTPEELRNKLGIKEKAPFLGWVDGERLFALPAEVQLLYKTRGFSETRVDLNFSRRGAMISAIFYVDEGRQERISKLTFSGAELFEAKALLEQISGFEGGPFFQPSIQNDVEKLENFYLNQGIRGTEIEPRVEKTDENLYSVVFHIQEGKKAVVDSVIITGNLTTKRGIILRELRLKEGDVALYDKIRESKSRLERLGIFTKVSIEEISLSSDRINLVINVTEGERNYASLGLGLETKSEPHTFVLWNNPLRLRGTAELIRSNIFGSAAQLSLVGQASLYEKRGVLTWEQPYLFGIPVPNYVNAWWESEERKSFSYERRGASLTGIKPVSKKLLFQTTLRWTSTTLYDLQVEESEVDRPYSPFSATSVSGSFIWDERNDPFNPEKGAFLSLVLERAFPFFKAESDFVKSFFKYQHFIPVSSRINFSLTARLGLGGGKVPIPIHERFFAGGSNSFRGARFDELGPKDPDSLKPRGGEALVLLNLELTFPLVSQMRELSGAVFYDKGNVFDEPKHFVFSSLQDAVGLGVRYRTPLGPVRFDLGWNLDAPREERKILAFITIGNVF
jgi:outer membrane protein assembly complex protein YaeT